MSSFRTSLRAERGVIRQSPETFGRSRLGVSLEVILPKNGQAKILLIAGQHGDEPETTGLLSSALRSILPEDLSAAVVLAMNPDGLLRGTRANAQGVDLNRNFPVPNWGEGEIHYRWTSEDPRDVKLSAGEGPASEPETQALLSLIERLQPEYVISIHAPLACVDDPLQTPIGKWLAEETGLEFVVDVGYPTPGSFGTWAKIQGLKLITWELPHLSAEEIRRRYDPILCRILVGDLSFL